VEVSTQKCEYCGCKDARVVHTTSAPDLRSHISLCPDCGRYSRSHTIGYAPSIQVLRANALKILRRNTQHPTPNT